MARQRVRPTLPILLWALADLVGVALLALGAAWLIQGPDFFRFRLLGQPFPSTTGEALVSLVLGLGLIVVAAIKMLAEALKQNPADRTAGHDAH